MDAWGDYRGQEHRFQWVVMHSEGNKNGKLIMCNTRHVWKTLIMAEQYLRDQIVKGTGCLEGIFTDANSIEHNREFKSHTAGRLMSTCH